MYKIGICLRKLSLRMILRKRFKEINNTIAKTMPLKKHDYRVYLLSATLGAIGQGQ